MKRWTGLIVVTLIALAASAPGWANDPPVAAGCVGTGGYDAEGEWQFATHKPLGAGFGLPKSCSPTVFPPVAGPPSWLPDPGNSDPWNYIFYADAWAQAAPIGHSTTLTLRADGDFACGDGTLTSTSDLNVNELSYAKGIRPFWWDLDWTATLVDGVGDITGTATYNWGETRALSGKIMIDDGATRGVGACNDSAGASSVLIYLVLS